LILSNLNMIQTSLDKYEMYKYLKDIEVPTVPTFMGIDRVKKGLESGMYGFPLVVKPRKGSESLGIEIIESYYELNEISDKVIKEELIIQPYYKHREYGIDVYIDMHTGNLIDLFIKEKIH